uniref:Homeobox domain-containing protein n=1 Tax=Meloidogyne hapla TaxID=6305 RepID=A0A1I8BGZ4_MELHA
MRAKFSKSQSTTPNFSNFILLNNLNDPNKAVSVGSDEENNQQQFNLTIENRRARTAFNQEQLRLLENVFNENPYPGNTQKEWLVKATQLDEDKIITWFSNRRARRRKALQNGVTNFNNLFIEANNNINSSSIKTSILSSTNFLNQNKLINQKMLGEILINNNTQQLQQQQQNQQIFNNNSSNGILLPFTSFPQSTNIPQLLPFFSPFGTLQYQNILKTNNQLNEK